MEKDIKLSKILKETFNTEGSNISRKAGAAKSEDPRMKFLQRFNYQPFDDWYQTYNRWIEGEEFSKFKMEEFLDETEDIMRFIKRVIEPSLKSSPDLGKDIGGGFQNSGINATDGYSGFRG